MPRLRTVAFALVATLIASLHAPGASAQDTSRVSRLGEYRGWSKATYDGSQRTSRYLTMRDGVRLAIDIIRPTRGGVPNTEPLPVVWTHHRYHRAEVRNDTVRSIADNTAYAKALLAHGYIVAAVDTRGGGASFGQQAGFFSPDETRNAYEVTEWLAKQPWSTGKIGMFGRSYLGITQYLAASTKPPHLKAIFPEMSVFEWYPFIYPGGIYRDDFFASWSRLTRMLDASAPGTWNGRPLTPVAPVQGDSGAALLAGAIAAHKKNRDIDSMWAAERFRNSVDGESGKRLNDERSPSNYLRAINASHVAVYTLGGWYDAFPRDAALYYRNLQVPQKLIIGPWFHGQSQEVDMAAEHLRWFDYWLKGIDNGIMREPPIHYRVIGAPLEKAWRSARRWPPPEARAERYYFHGGAAATTGSLATGAAPRVDSSDAYTVNYTTTLGKKNRWAATYGGPNGYPDLAPNDAKALTYTTPPLGFDVEVTGHPVVHLWVASTARDGDFFAYLEDVDEQGRSNYVTEGALRASHRALGAAPYDAMGLPYHRSFSSDSLSLPAGPVELEFDLQPTSQLFLRGHRIRLTVAAADADNNKTPRLSPPPTVHVHRGGDHASYVVLPVMPAEKP